MNPWITITAASSGLGQSLVKIFAQNGYSFILHARNAGALDKVTTMLGAASVQYKCVTGDLTEPNVLEKIAEQSEMMGSSILINNAGKPCPGKEFLDLSMTEIEAILNTNLLVPIRLCHLLYEHFMALGHSAIININSIVGIEPKPSRTAYAASRFGLRGFSSSLALEAGKNGIQVFGVYVSRIKTRQEFTEGWEPASVAEHIYKHLQSGSSEDLILDGRPKK